MEANCDTNEDVELNAYDECSNWVTKYKFSAELYIKVDFD